METRKVVYLMYASQRFTVHDKSSLSCQVKPTINWKVSERNEWTWGGG